MSKGPWIPAPGPQEEFLLCSAFELAFGGATGGGNTEVLLVDPLRFIHHADFRGVIFVSSNDELRRRLTERSAKIFLSATRGQATLKDRVWTFPSGAQIELAVIRRPADRFKFDADWHYVAFDDLTQFDEASYRFMLSRLRSSNPEIEPRVRVSVQPSGPGREWVLKRFAPWLTGVFASGTEAYINKAKSPLRRALVWATVEDNPYADPNYTERLAMAYDAVTLEQRCNGNWEITHEEHAPKPITERPEGMGLLDFITAISPRFQPPHHLSDVVEFFERIDRGEEVRGLVSVPRRHGKTEMLLHGIAWLLARHPEWTIGFAGYSNDFTSKKSRRARDLAIAAGVELRGDSKSTREWRTTAGGGLLSDGIGGGWTGHGVQVLIVDDPHKDRPSAESPVQRARVWDWWSSAGITSVEPDLDITQRGAALVVHTRWHPGDLIGLLVKQSKEGAANDEYAVAWQYVNLPAITEVDGKQCALWPERWPLEAMLRRKREVTAFEWASLYMGQPRPRGGKVFGAPSFYRELPKVRIKRGYGIDLAYTENTKNDRSVCTEMLKHNPPPQGPKDKPLPEYYIPNVISKHEEAPAFTKRLKALQKLKRAPMLFLGAGTEKGAAQFIADDVPGFRIEPATGDKFNRAQPLAGPWNDGRVFVPDPDVFDVPWLADFLDVMDSFTGEKDARDDEVDSAAAAFKCVQGKAKISPTVGYA